MTVDRRGPAEVLARARRTWSPGEADAVRVRRAISAALAAGPTPGEDAAPAHPRASASAWTSRLLVAGAIAAASGGVGYWAGLRASLREAPRAAPLVSLASRSVTAVEPRLPPSVAPSPAVATPPLAMPSLVPSRHDLHSGRRSLETRTASQSNSLAVEVAALRNAERALRDGNPGLALAFLQELDRQVPNGQLAEERDAASTLARCARGDHPFGVNLGAEFTERHPGSVYRARVEQACPETDSPASGDSSPRRQGP